MINNYNLPVEIVEMLKEVATEYGKPFDEVVKNYMKTVGETSEKVSSVICKIWELSKTQKINPKNIVITKSKKLKIKHERKELKLKRDKKRCWTRRIGKWQR